MSTLPMGPVDAAADGSTRAAIRLRLPHPDDADAVVDTCRDGVTQHFLGGLPADYAKSDALDWIEAAPDKFAGAGAVFTIADPVTDRFLGSVGLHTTSGPARAVGCLVAPWARGRGIATAAMRTLAGWAFGTASGGSN